MKKGYNIHKKWKREIDVSDLFLEYLLYKNESNNFPIDYEKEIKIKKAFLFILKIADIYMPTEQKRIFIKFWLIDRGNKNFSNFKTPQTNSINFKLSLKNIKNFLIQTGLSEIIWEYLNENK